MKDWDTAQTPNSELEEIVGVVKQFGFSDDTARLVAEDIETRGPRKPAAYEVELARIRRAQGLDSQGPA
jgi:hypothetical protein